MTFLRSATELRVYFLIWLTLRNDRYIYANQLIDKKLIKHLNIFAIFLVPSSMQWILGKVFVSGNPFQLFIAMTVRKSRKTPGPALFLSYPFACLKREPLKNYFENVCHSTFWKSFIQKKLQNENIDFFLWKVIKKLL